MSDLIEDPAFVKGTLEWCNIRRAEQGKEPLDRLPKGFRQSPASCPCGAASGVIVGSTVWITEEEYVNVGFNAAYAYTNARRSNEPMEERVLPSDVKQFVQHFDNGDLPQYDAATD